MSETIDLTNYPVIAQNQGGNCEITSIVALHGINLAKTGYSLLLTTLTSISTTVHVVGENMLGYTGFAVINDEIVQVNSSVAIWGNTSLSITRAMHGTVAQTISSIDNDYIFPVNLFFVDTMNYKAKTDLNESDLWGFSLDNGRVILNENTDEWKIESPSKLYNPYINKRVFLFRGVDGQFIKDYEGVSTNYTIRDNGEIEITISDSVANVYSEPLNSNRLFDNIYPKEILQTMFPEYKVKYVADTNESHYPLITNFSLGEFEKYSDFLQYLCKKYALRIIFRKNNTIHIFSDIQQDNIVPTEILTPTNIVSITNNSDGKLVINKAEGSYVLRKDYVNEEDYNANNKYIKWYYYKDFTATLVPYTILNANKEWQEISFSMSADELKYISYNDYVLIVLPDSREFWCKPSDIDVDNSILKVMAGYDKACHYDYYGRLDTLSTISSMSLRLYYAPASKPIVSKYTRNIGGEDVDSFLYYPIVEGEEEIIYLNYGAEETNDSTFSGLVKGNIVTNTFIDNTKLLYGKEYAQNLLDCPLYLYSNRIDPFSDDYIKINTFDNSGIQVKTEWSDDKEQNLKVTFKNTLGGSPTIYEPVSVSGNVVEVSLANYSALNISDVLQLNTVATDSYAYSSFINNKNLVWMITNKSTSGGKYYITLDMEYPNPVSTIQLKFKVMTNTRKHQIESLESQTAITVSATDYTSIFAGDCLKLAGMLSSDARYTRYLEYQNVKWLVRSKFTESGKYYIIIDSAYPKPVNTVNFDFIKFDGSGVVLINEFFIRGNPVMESTQTYSYYSPESIEFYGTKEYALDGKSMEKSHFEKVAGYVFNTYLGLDSTNTRMKVNVELDQRVDIEIGNVFYLTDGVISGYNAQKVMVVSKEVSYQDNGLQEQLELLTIGDYSTQKVTIAINTSNSYSPVIAPTYSHLGGEGTSEQTTNQNKNNQTVTLYDSSEGTITISEVALDTFSAITSLTSSIQTSTLTFSLPIINITANDDYRATLLRDGAEGVILLNNEYFTYKAVGTIAGNATTLEITKRTIANTTASIIVSGQKVQFFKILQKVTSEGIVSNDVLLGNGIDNYIKVSTTNGTDVKSTGNIDISNNSNKNQLHFDTVDNASFISMNDKQIQLGLVKELAPSALFPSTYIPDFNGMFVGDKALYNENYMYYDGSGLNFKGKYFNGIAYCRTVDDLIGALHGNQYIYDSGGVKNPYYAKEVNGIILTGTSYTIPTLTIYPFGATNTIIPRQNISFITSLGGTGGSEACTLDFGGKKLVLNYDIEITNLIISSLGNSTDATQALAINSNGVRIDSVIFKDLGGYIDGAHYTSSVLSNIRILSFKAYCTSLIKKVRSIDTVVIVAENLSLSPIVYFEECVNIKNINIFNGTVNEYNLDKVTVFYNSLNISNVILQDNYYNRIAEKCANLSDFCILEPSITYTLNSYYFFDCENISNIKFSSQNKHIYKFNNCKCITNCDGSNLRDSLLDCSSDTNNSWNIKRIIATDTVIPDTTYYVFSSKLQSQYLHIYIKDVATRFVTAGVDLNVDDTVMGSYGLYKFIYNSTLSQWELHQLNQDRVLDGGYVYIKFTTIGTRVYFHVKSQSTGKYITILADEIK